MVFCNAPAHLNGGSFLESVGPDNRCPHLAGDRNDRHAVQLGVGEGGDGVRRPRTAGGHEHANFPGGPGVSLSRKPAALLMPRKYDANLIPVPGEGLMDGHTSPPGISKNHFNAVIHKRLHDDLSAADGFAFDFDLRTMSLWRFRCRAHGSRLLFQF